MNRLRARIAASHRDLLLFLSSIAMVGCGESIVNSIFNNFLNETFALNSLQRTFMELPRELPGFLVVFVSAALFFVRGRRLAVVATAAGACGLVLMGFFSVTFHWMFAWLFIFSLGQHLFMPLSTGITMELAREGETGKRLGQFNAVRNIAAIAGSFAIVVAFKCLHCTFKAAFCIAALFYLCAAVLIRAMAPGRANAPDVHLRLLTFAPWVLVTVFRQPTAVLATLLTVSGAAGILFQPALGRAIDTFGEKTVLTAEALLLILVCAGYGLGRTLLPPGVAFAVACCCYVLDQLLMSVNMARSTYMKKIATDPAHVTPALTMAVSLDHIFSICIALTGGLVWAKWGYQTVFLFGAGIACVNLVSAQFIKVPGRV